MSRLVTAGGNIVWIALWTSICYYGIMPWFTWFLVVPWCVHGFLLAIPPDEAPPGAPWEDWMYDPPEPINKEFIARRNEWWEDDLWDD